MNFLVVNAFLMSVSFGLNSGVNSAGVNFLRVNAFLGANNENDKF